MSATTAPLPSTIPKLRPGEHLSRREFERRYQTMPDVKAELLDGVVYVMSAPVSANHGNPHFNLITWLGNYALATPGIEGGDYTTVVLCEETEVQPDAFLRILESHGGQSRIDESNYIFGTPELIGEIAYSSLNYDRNTKRPVYQQAGVREFILWRVEDEMIDWFALRGSGYELLTAGTDGIIRSEVFPGLWLDAKALARRDMPMVARVLQGGINSPEHAAFVNALRKAKTVE